MTMAVLNEVARKIDRLVAMQQGCNEATKNYLSDKIAGLKAFMEVMERAC